MSARVSAFAPALEPALEGDDESGGGFELGGGGKLMGAAASGVLNDDVYAAPFECWIRKWSSFKVAGIFRSRRGFLHAA